MIYDLSSGETLIDIPTLAGFGDPEHNARVLAACKILCPKFKGTYSWGALQTNQVDMASDKVSQNIVYEIYFSPEDRTYVVHVEYPQPTDPDCFKGLTIGYSISGALILYYTDEFVKSDGIYLNGKISDQGCIIPGCAGPQQQEAQAKALELLECLAENGQLLSYDPEGPSTDRIR